MPGGRVDTYASLRIAMPGSSLPSRYSRVAPPPVETCEKRPARPSDSIAAIVSPPPTSVYPPALAMASPTALVPSAKSREPVPPHAHLGRNLRSAHHGDHRPSRVVERLVQRRQLGFHQLAGKRG